MEWIGRDTGRSHTCVSDVSIGKISEKRKQGNVNYASVRFRNGVHGRISKSGYVVYAYVGSRIYFKEDDGKKGFKFTSFTENKQGCGVKFPLANDNHIGDYSLMYDKTEKLWYVDTDIKE